MGDKLSKEVVDFQPLTSIRDGNQWGLAVAHYSDGKQRGFVFGFVRMLKGSPVIMYQFRNCWSLGEDGWYCNALCVYSSDLESQYVDLEMRNYSGCVWERSSGNTTRTLFYFDSEYVKSFDFRVYDLYQDTKDHGTIMSVVCERFLNGRTAHKIATSFTDQVELGEGIYIRKLTSFETTDAQPQQQQQQRASWMMPPSRFHLVQKIAGAFQERLITWCRWNSSNAVSLRAGVDGNRVMLSLYLNRKNELIVEIQDGMFSSASVLQSHYFLSLNFDPFLPYLQPLKELQADVQKTIPSKSSQDLDFIFFETKTTH